MELLLKEEVKDLGKPGDIIDVKRGYARNYLLPRGLAIVVTADNLETIKSEHRKVEKRIERDLVELAKYAKELSKVSCTIPAKVSEGDTLYGSVSEDDIVAALKKEGFDVDRKLLNMAEHIKHLGMYELHIRFAPEIESTIKVWVVEE